MLSIKLSVQAEPRDIDSWLSLARRLESAGFEALLVGDHPGSGPSPWPALGAAAAVTTTLKLGTYVLQAGVRNPLQAAADAATLNVLAPGRVLFGLGAGHTFREWEVTGRQRPTPADRVGRLVEFVDVVARLLDGEAVTVEGHYLRLVDARLEGVLDGARSVRLVVGGGSRAVLRLAATRAEVVALSGLGRTLPDGYRHDVRWSNADLGVQLRVIREESERVGITSEIEALVQNVTVTDDRRWSSPSSASDCPGRHQMTSMRRRSCWSARSRRWAHNSRARRNNWASAATWCVRQHWARPNGSCRC